MKRKIKYNGATKGIKSFKKGTSDENIKENDNSDNSSDNSNSENKQPYMPQIGWLEILAVIIVVFGVGPKEFPIALKKIGSYVGKLKNTISNLQKEVSKATDNINLEKDLDKKYKQKS